MDWMSTLLIAGALVAAGACGAMMMAIVQINCGERAHEDE